MTRADDAAQLVLVPRCDREPRSHVVIVRRPYDWQHERDDTHTPER